MGDYFIGVEEEEEKEKEAAVSDHLVGTLALYNVIQVGKE